MTTLKHLLSDKFVDFSAKIADVHNEIKTATANYKAEMKSLQEKADGLRTDFETWEKEQDALPTKTKSDLPDLNTFGGHPKSEKKVEKL